MAEWRDDRGRVCARAFAGVSGRSIDCPGVGVFSFGEDRRDVAVWPDHGISAEAVTECFDRIVHPLALQALGHQVLHGSASRGPDGVWAFCARSGGGKSTIAYALAQRGFPQVADDAVVLDLSARVKVVPIDFSARLRTPSFAHFTSNPIRPSDRPPVAEAPLAGVFLLEQDASVPAPSTLRLTETDAFHAVLTHCHVFDEHDPHERARLVDAAQQIGTAVPVVRLRYPPRFDQIGDLVTAVSAAAFAAS